MKKVIALVLAALLFALGVTACRTIEDTKPKNETTTPNIVSIM